MSSIRIADVSTLNAHPEPCLLLDWDTSFWGFPVAQVRGDTLTRERVSHINAWCRNQSITCLYFLSRADDADTTRAAEENNFHLADIRMTFEYEFTRLLEAGRHDANGTVAVRDCVREDIGALQDIASQIYQNTRFYYDRNFPRERCRELYETWIKRSYEGYADTVLVAELSGKSVGYISCHLQGNPLVGKIGLVGVSGEVQGRGIGRTLTLQALQWFRIQGASVVTVVTQGSNLAAQQLYQRCGFVSQAVGLWYHKWYAPSKQEGNSR